MWKIGQLLEKKFGSSNFSRKYQKSSHRQIQSRDKCRDRDSLKNELGPIKNKMKNHGNWSNPSLLFPSTRTGSSRPPDNSKKLSRKFSSISMKLITLPCTTTGPGNLPKIIRRILNRQCLQKFFIRLNIPHQQILDSS